MAESVLVGRQSSHFTRVVRIVAAELGVPLRLHPIHDLMSLDPADYGGNPALKLPVLQRGGDTIYGCLNICRVLAAGSGRGELLVFPEHGLDPLHLDAGELVFNAMGVHTEIVFHEVVSKRPPDAASFKRRAGLLGSLAWLDANLDAVLARLPPRRTSVFEVALYCLLTHIPFRNPMDLSGFARLAAFVREFGARPSAQATPYRFDAPPPESAPRAGAAEAPGARIAALAGELDEALREMRDDRALAADPRFDALVAALEHGTPADRQEWMTSPSTALACASLAAMRRAGDDDRVGVARVLDRVGYFALPFALAYLRESPEPRVFALALLRLGPWAADYPALRSAIWDYLGDRLAAGLVPRLDATDADLDWCLEERRTALADFDPPAVKAFLAELERLDQGRHVRSLAQDFAYCPAISRRLDDLVARLQAPTRPHLLLVGDPGRGKAALLRAALRSLAREGWTVIEASPAELLAGVQHVHPLDERIESLVAGLSGEGHVWHVRHWFQLLEDAEDGSPTLLERLWPHLQSRRLQLVGTATAHTRDRAVQDLPGFESVVGTLDIPDLASGDANALAEDWALRQSNRLGVQVIDAALLEEALGLARWSSRWRAEPGRTLGMLEDALAAAGNESPSVPTIARRHVLAALCARTGLPLSSVDRAICKA